MSSSSQSPERDREREGRLVSMVGGLDLVSWHAGKKRRERKTGKRNCTRGFIWGLLDWIRMTVGGTQDGWRTAHEGIREGDNAG